MAHRIILAAAAAAALAVTPPSPVVAWEVGQMMPRIDMIDGTGAHVPFTAWTGRWTALRIGGSWCPPCVAERPAAEAFAIAQGIDVYTLTSPPRTSTVDTQFPRDVDDAKRRGYPLGRTVRRDPAVALDPPPPRFDFPTTFLISPDGRIAARWMGTRVYSDKKAHPFAAQPTWRDWTEASLACAGAPLRAGLTEEAQRLRTSRIPPACG